jgi:peptidoglycan/xylan/chitin deacetylase (PgdA/CDA1 family)
MKLSEAQNLYKNSGHEIAVHGYKHLHLDRLFPTAVLEEILEDRKNLEQQYGVITRGMAYAYGNYNNEVVDAISKCGICYSRTTRSTGNFSFPENWLALNPTCHHGNPKLMELADKFVNTKARNISDNWMFYVWGHSYEFDNSNNWEVIENFAEYVSNKEDVWYATNIEIYDYIKAYEGLKVSVDQKTVYNPSVIDVWFAVGKNIYCVKGGETLYL